MYLFRSKYAYILGTIWRFRKIPHRVSRLVWRKVIIFSKKVRVRPISWNLFKSRLFRGPTPFCPFRVQAAQVCGTDILQASVHTPYLYSCKTNPLLIRRPIQTRPENRKFRCSVRWLNFMEVVQLRSNAVRSCDCLSRKLPIRILKSQLTKLKRCPLIISGSLGLSIITEQPY